MARRFRWRRDDGQDLVEYAIVLFLLMLLVLGIMEFSVIILSYNTLANAVREGARYGIVHPGDLPATSVVVRQRALALDQANLQVNTTQVGLNIQVEAIYDLRLMTGLMVEALGGNPTLRLSTVAAMRIE